MLYVALGMAVSRRATEYSSLPASSQARSIHRGARPQLFDLLTAKPFEDLPWQAGATLTMTRGRAALPRVQARYERPRFTQILAQGRSVQ